MQSTYKQFCPVAMAAEILCKRWSVLVLRELVVGSTRFSDLRRGVPRMSPTLLSQRLREFEAAGILIHREAGDEYILTDAGKDMQAVVESIGVWGQRWVTTDVMLENLDPALLMWDMRRNINTAPLPATRSTIRFEYSDLPASKRSWWLIVDPDTEIDLCAVDPGFEIDLWVTTDLRTMTAIWLGQSTTREARKSGALLLDGDKALARSIQVWLGCSHFASEKKRC
jgi:DNA-binding HxlR family transcriptional regulator